MKITIPESMSGVADVLDGLGRLVTARQWERAALVYAATTPGSGGPRTPSNGGQLSFRAFAELGIYGLRSATTVSAYAEAWQSAVDDGYAEPSALGGSVELPDPEEHHFPPNSRRPDSLAEAFDPGPSNTERMAGGQRLAKEIAPQDRAEVARDARPDEDREEEPPASMPPGDWEFQAARLAGRVNDVRREHEALRARFYDDEDKLAGIAERIRSEVAEFQLAVQRDLLLRAGR